MWDMGGLEIGLTCTYKGIISSMEQMCVHMCVCICGNGGGGGGGVCKKTLK